MKTRDQEFDAVMAENRKLKTELIQRAYLHPMDLASNIKNIQMLLPAHTALTIGKDAVDLTHVTLDLRLTCPPDEIPTALKNCEFIHERLANE